MKRATTKKKPAGKKADPATIRRRTRDRNRRFRALSPEKKRIAIAKEVLEQLGGNIRAKSRTYFASKKVDGEVAKYLRALKKLERADLLAPAERRAAEKTVADIGEKQFCDLFEGTECHVCGIGAGFVAAVRLGDNIKVKDLHRDDIKPTDGKPGLSIDTMRPYLERYFPRDQVALIECAFERDDRFNGAVVDGSWIRFVDWEPAYDAQKFGERYRTPAKRLAAIFQNILDNKGVFNPSAALRAEYDARVAAADAAYEAEGTVH